MAEPRFHACLIECGLSAAQIATLVVEGYTMLNEFAISEPQDIVDLAKRVQGLPANMGGMCFGQLHLIKLKGLLSWIKDWKRHALPIDPNEFDKEVLVRAIELLKTKSKEAKMLEATTKPPNKLLPHTLRGWNTFNWELKNYLADVKGVTGVPLIYVIKKEQQGGEQEPVDTLQKLIWQAPLQGNTYQVNNKKVYHIICDAVTNTNGWAWIKDVPGKNGCLAMSRLREHYDGPVAKTRLVQEAKDRLKMVHYCSKVHFTFEKYVTMLKECFNALKEDDRGILEWDKIDYLLDGIQCQSLALAVSSISMNPALRASFINASNKLSHKVQRVFSNAQRRNKRNVSQVTTEAETDARNSSASASQPLIRGHFSLQGQGRGPQSAQLNRTIINGIDMTDINHNFNPKEWQRLQGHYDYIFAHRS